MKIITINITSAVTFASERWRPIEDYCSIWVFAKGEKENNINSNAAINDSDNIEADNDNRDSYDYHRNEDYDSKKDLAKAYAKIVHWKQNLFMMPSCAKGKKYIE